MSTYYFPDNNQAAVSNLAAQLGACAFAEFGNQPGQVPDNSNPGYDPIATCKSNLAATTPPGTGNDITQGYVVGSTWINISANTTYQCTNNTKAAAVWVKTSP